MPGAHALLDGPACVASAVATVGSERQVEQGAACCALRSTCYCSRQRIPLMCIQDTRTMHAIGALHAMEGRRRRHDW